MNFMRKYSTLIGKTYLQVEQLPYCSDVYSFGHVLNQFNAEILKTSVLYNMAEQRLDYCSQKGPAAKDLHKFLTNLFH